jgi:hypothetical protein
MAHEIARLLAESLPTNLRDQFESAAQFTDSMDPTDWARYVWGLQAIVLAPERTLAALDEEEIRRL